MEGARIEQHGPLADRAEVVLDLEIVQHVLLRQHLPEQRPQLRDVPGVVAQRQAVGAGVLEGAGQPQDREAPQHP